MRWFNYMSDDKTLIELKQQSYSTWMQDGLNFIWMGIGMLCTSFFSLANSMRDLLNLGLIPGLVGLLFYGIYERLREKITYPRIGYVKPRKVEIDSYSIRSVGFVFLLYIVIITLHVLIVGSPFDIEALFRYGLLYIGIAMILPSLWSAKATGNRNYNLLGILTSISGLVFMVTDFIDPRVGFALYTILWGSIVTVAGITKLVLFTKSYPLLELPETDVIE